MRSLLRWVVASVALCLTANAHIVKVRGSIVFNNFDVSSGLLYGAPVEGEFRSKDLISFSANGANKIWRYDAHYYLKSGSFLLEAPAEILITEFGGQDSFLISSKGPSAYLGTQYLFSSNSGLIENGFLKLGLSLSNFNLLTDGLIVSSDYKHYAAYHTTSVDVVSERIPDVTATFGALISALGLLTVGKLFPQRCRFA